MYLRVAFIIVVSYSCSLVNTTKPVEVRVKTKFGEISGLEQQFNDDGSKYCVFYAIPYAKVTQRFEDPKPWTDQYQNGVLKATKTKRCIQELPHSKDKVTVVIGEEDCLFLNIYTPTLDAAAGYDVVFFIHGGAFVQGAGHSQTPEYLMLYNKHVVFVSINYRLGPFGFLTTGDDVVPGNMGLKDQVMALRWVKENIHLFGGDPKKVMLAGMSAGAVSVHLHYMSPMSRDLFNRGISMSGVALSPLIKDVDERKGSEYLAVLVGCTTENTKLMIECLRGIPADKIVRSIADDDVPWKVFNAYFPFGPVIDMNSPEPFLVEHPYFTLRSGNVKNAPWLASATTAEGLKPGGLFIDDDAQVWDLNEHWEEILPYLLMFKYSASKKNLEKIAQHISQHYLMGHPIARHNRATAIKLIGDRLYMTSIENSVRLHAKATRADVYFYMFGYRGEKSYSNVLSKTNSDLGASHIDDMIYILKMNGFDPMNGHATMVERMVGVWTSFMKDGVPSLPVLNKPWPPVNKNIVIKGKMDYVIILGMGQMKIASTMDLSERGFWERLPLDELHVSGDRRVPPYIKRLRRSQSVMRHVFRVLTSLKTKLVEVTSKVRHYIGDKEAFLFQVVELMYERIEDAAGKGPKYVPEAILTL